MEPEQTIPGTQNTGENTNEFSDYTADYAESESFRDKLAGFFSNRRRLLVISAVLLLLIGGIAAFFAFRNNRGPGSFGQAEVGKLPLAGKGSAFDVFAGYPKDGTIVLSWSTDKYCDGRVYYGNNTNYGFWADDQDTLAPAKYSKEHRVVVSGLNPNDVYNFKATSLCDDNTVLSSSNFALKAQGDSNPPTVKLTNRNAGDTMSGSSQICAEATDDRGVQRLTLLIDGRPVQSVVDLSSYCFTVNTSDIPNGPHSVAVTATDGTNDQDTPVIEIVIDNPDNPDDENPTDFPDKFGCVKIDPGLQVQVRPITAGDTLSGRVDLNLVVTASGGYQIQRTVLAVDNWFKAEDYSSPYAFTLDTRTYIDGDHEVTGIAMTSTGVCNDYINNGTVAVKFNNPTDANSAPQIFMVSAASTTDTITVTWTSDKPTDSVVKYMKDTTVQRVSKTELTTGHSVDLTGLTPGVWYQLTLEGTAANGLTSSYGTYAATKTVYDDDPLPPPCTAGNCPSPQDPPPPCNSVNSGIVVTLTSPANNSTVSGNMTLTATANQPVVRMMFFIGNVKISEAVSAPYSMIVNSAPYPNGVYVIRAIAMASNGACSSVSYTGPHTSRITINNTGGPDVPCTVGNCEEPPVGPPPPVGCTTVDSTLVVTLSSPQNGDILRGDMNLAATANKPIQRMAFLLGNQEIASDTLSPYSLVVNSALYPDGNYVVRAVGVTSNGTCSSIAYTGPHTATVTINNSNVIITPPASLPTVTLYATLSTINSGASTNLNWTTQNATSCTASNGWSGSKILNGSQSISPSVTTTYVLTCTNSVGSASQNTVVTVDTNPNDGPMPVVALFAAPSTVVKGNSFVLSWSTQNATSCAALNGWSGTKQLSGNETFAPAVTTTYVLNCTGANGSATQSIIVTVDDNDNPPCQTGDCEEPPVGPPPPVGCEQVDTTLLVNLTSPQSGSTVSGNMTLSATPNREILRMAFLIGNQEIGADPSSPYSMIVDSRLYPNGNYTIRAVAVTAEGTCSSVSYTGPHTANIAINNSGDDDDDDDDDNDNELPTVTLTATPSTINQGQSTTLTWSTQNATSCTASNGWSGGKSLSGTQDVSPTATATYVLSCTNSVGSADQSTIVAVDTTPGDPLPTVSLSATPSTIDLGESFTLAWSTENATSCTASNGWSGGKQLSGSLSQSPTADTTYVLSCTGPGGSATQNIIVTVNTGNDDDDDPTNDDPNNPASVPLPTPTGLKLDEVTQNSVKISWNAVPSKKFIFCATETGYSEPDVCDVSGTQEVAYGANGTYIYITTSSDVKCANNYAGGPAQFVDPVPGVKKYCYLSYPANLAGYNVYRNGVVVKTGPELTYSDTGVSSGNIYNYHVRAKDTSGVLSAESQVVEAFIDPAFNINEPSALADDILVNFRFSTTQAATSVISFGTSPSNLNRTIDVTSGVSIWDGSVIKVAEGFWRRVSKKLVSFAPRARAAFSSVTLNASSSLIDRGQTAKLTWTSSDVSNCVGNWNPTSPGVAAGGEVTVSPTSTTRYTISCISNEIVNGSFASGTDGWTDNSDSGISIGWQSGSLRLPGGGAGYARADQQITTTPGMIYTASIRVRETPQGPVLFQIGTSEGGTQLVNASLLASGAGFLPSSGRVYQFMFTARTSTTHIRVSSGWQNARVDDIFVGNETVRNGVTVQVNHPYSAFATGLTANTTYYYKIVSTSTNSSGAVDESPLLSFVTAKSPSVNNLTASISWTHASSGAGRVRYSRLPLSDPNAVLTNATASMVAGSPNTFTAILTGLAPQKIYYYRQEILNAQGAVIYSSPEQQFTTPATNN